MLSINLFEKINLMPRLDLWECCERFYSFSRHWAIGLKAEYGWQYIFWFISSPCTSKRKAPKINLHYSELIPFVHVPGGQLPKLVLLYICITLSLMVENFNGNLYYCNVSFWLIDWFICHSHTSTLRNSLSKKLLFT